MAYKTNQFSDAARLAADDVSRAVALVTELVTAKRGQCGTNEAIRNIAREGKLPASIIRRLFHPSRHPKDIGVRVWRGIRAAYLKHLRQQIRELELKIIRLEASDHVDDGVRDALVDDAKSLIRRIRKTL
jgi:hypothetical protein